jgi:hypothetical protein
MSTTSPLDLLIGWVLMLSFLTFGFCMATLRSHVDEEKVRKEADISSLFREPIPPERVLTAVGLRRAKIAKVAMGLFAVGIIVVVIRKIA